MSADQPGMLEGARQYAHLALPLALGLLGSVVRTLTGLKEGCTWRRLLLELSINSTAAVFAGAVVGLYLENMDVTYGTKCALIALASVSGKDLVAQWLTKKWLDALFKCVLPGKQ